MKATALFLAAVLLAGCATQESAEDQSTQDRVQAIRDYVDVRGLEEVRRLPVAITDNEVPLTQNYVIYRSTLNTYLVEFERRCWKIGPDDRRNPNYIYARFDTHRGCRVNRIFSVTREDVAELESIHSGVGSRAPGP